MTTTLNRKDTAYTDAKRHFHACLKSYSQCRRNCRFGGRWPKLTRDAKNRYHQAARTLRAAQVQYYASAKAVLAA